MLSVLVCLLSCYLLYCAINRASAFEQRIVSIIFNVNCSESGTEKCVCPLLFFYCEQKTLFWFALHINYKADNVTICFLNLV